MSFITSIGTAIPKNCIEQSVIATFMSKAMHLTYDEERRLNALYRATGIEKRYSVLSDYGRTNDFQFYTNTKTLEPFPTTRKRLDIFRKEAVNVSVEAIKNCLARIQSPSIKLPTWLL